MEEFVVKIDGNYYSGQNEKYADMYNITGSGALGAKRMNIRDAENLKAYFERLGRKVEIEKYDSKKYLSECISKIIQYEKDRQNGNDCGYAIENIAKRALEYLKQI